MTTLRRAAVEAKNSDAIDHAVRVGLVAYGVVHLLIAWLILQIAFGETGKNASAEGAMHTLAQQPLGEVLVWAVGIGFVILVLWRLLDAVVVRGLSVAARRLAYQRALSRRETGVREGAEGGEIEEPVLDIEQVNQQSLRLLRLGLLVGFVAALYGVWADLITVFTYLDKVVLYEFGGGEGVSPVPISLSDLLGALVIIAIAFVLAGNLPGLLEVLLLSRLQLAQGSAYAITTLLSYVIVGVGFVVYGSALVGRLVHETRLRRRLTRAGRA